LFSGAQPNSAPIAEKVEEVIPWLRILGFRADEARSAAAQCEGIPDAPIAERVLVALRFHGTRVPSRRVSYAAASPG
jgi:hypothetical protein